MQPESAGVVWRSRTMWEAADLGVRLLRSWRRPVFLTYLSVAVPLFLLYATLGALVAWLPLLLIWLSKPWLDRSILFVLSRALFGVSTSPNEIWSARTEVWWSQFVWSFTWRRLSASRAFTQPVLQLEGLRGAARHLRLKQITARHRSVARAVTLCFTAAELALFAGLFSLQVWLAPHRGVEAWSDFEHLTLPGQIWLETAEYAAVVLFLEPFYVAAGFGMYLNRRVELEAWDIEQEFRHAFA
jgi:hypothetical protein